MTSPVPTIDYIIKLLGSTNTYSVPPAQRAVLLAMAVLAEHDLNDPNGYNFIRPGRVATLIGRVTSTADRTLRDLVRAGRLVAVVNDPEKRGHRRVVTGNELTRAHTVVGFRLPEGSFS